MPIADKAALNCMQNNVLTITTLTQQHTNSQSLTRLLHSSTAHGA